MKLLLQNIICLVVYFIIPTNSGVKIKKFKYELNQIKSKENIIYYKDKLRDELKNAVEKENYLSPEDAKLINDFINKIN